VVPGSRSAVVLAAAEALLTSWGWTQLQPAAAVLSSSSSGSSGTPGLGNVTQLQQLSQVAQLLPKSVGLAGCAQQQKQQQRRQVPEQQQQQQLLADEASVAGLRQPAAHLKASVSHGAALAALPDAQMQMLRQIATSTKAHGCRQPNVPRFGDARKQRLLHAAAAAAEAALAARGRRRRPSTWSTTPTAWARGRSCVLHNRCG